MTEPQWITGALLQELSAEAQATPRLRKNRNFHCQDDPAHRLLNALQPGTYIRPHRHFEPPKAETAVAVAGRMGVIIFDQAGNVLDRRVIAPEGPVIGLDIPAQCWHTFVALEPGSIFLECKAGPYAPPGPNEIAPWAPAEGDPTAPQFEADWRRHFEE